MNIKDIARLAETSVATVSRVINGDPKVAESTRQKVQKVIKDNHFVLNVNSRNLRTKKSNRILVIVPTIVNSFYSRIIQGIEARAEEKGYDVLIAITNLEEARELKYLELLKTKQVDGCISLFSMLPAEEVSRLASQYAFVQCAEPTLNAKVTSVVIDNRQAIYEVTSEFIKQGHRHIAMITGDYYKYSEYSRYKGYEEALIENDIPINTKYVKKTFYRYKDGSDAAAELLNEVPRPTAIVCASDSLAIGAINYALSKGIKVGKELAIIGFDNTSITSNYVPTISTIAQPRFDLGTTAFDLVYEQLIDEEKKIKKVILAHQIIHRDSTQFSPINYK